jgi:hypothetical protein
VPGWRKWQSGKVVGKCGSGGNKVLLGDSVASPGLRGTVVAWDDHTV